MPKISLAAYSVTVRKLHQAEENLPLDSFDSKHSLLDILTDYCRLTQTEQYHNQDDKKLLQIANFCANDGTIAGTVLTGEYGYEAGIYDATTAKKSYNKKSQEAEMLPFYFLFYVRPKTDRGVAIFQRFGNAGIRTLLTKSFEQFFQKRHPDFRVHLNPLIRRELLQHYLDQGELKKLELTQFTVPKSIEDVLAVNGIQEHVNHVKITLSAKRNQFLPEPRWLRRLAQGDNYQDIVELAGLRNAGYEQLHIEVKIGTSTKKIDISDLSRLRSYFDITDELTLGPSGHPEFREIHDITRELLDNIVEEIIDPDANET